MQNRTVLVTDVRDVVPAGHDSERAVTETKHDVFDVAAPRGSALDRRDERVLRPHVLAFLCVLSAHGGRESRELR